MRKRWTLGETPKAMVSERPARSTLGAGGRWNEKIQTTGTGSVQVLFIDKTTLNVGPNSTLLIDRFVFNPAAGRSATHSATDHSAAGLG
jgi:hypothetical protein